MTQKDLFGNSNIETVKGLELYPEFISAEEEKKFLKHIDDSKWLNDLSRRVQHYGFKYDYRARKIDNSFFLGKLPNWLKELASSIHKKKIIDFMPDQAIINEYEPGQGIAPHIDCEPCFGDTIISLSLGSTCIINFEKKPNSKNKIEILLNPRTLLTMKQICRYDWYHGINHRKTDKVNGNTIKRDRRVSITFRKVILE